MKILFICGSLEPNKNGVGDYVYRISKETAKKGYSVQLIAINDNYTKTEVYSTLSVAQKNIEIIRLPSIETWKHRLITLKIEIENYNPDWISLQFVPFIYNSKGLLFGLATKLKRSFGVRKIHIMIHELWVGMAIEEPLKLKLWGMLQKYLIKKFLKELTPNVVQTQTYLYQAQLRNIGFNAGYLPLFSNIPVVSKEVNSHSKKIMIVLFGSIHKNAPVEALSKEAAEYANKHGKGIHLSLVGRNGNEQEHWVAVWKAPGLTSEVLGEKSSEEIAEILNEADAGIVTTAYAVVEKSGSLAALRSYGLPVLCVSPPWSPFGIKQLTEPIGVFNYVPGNFEQFFCQPKSSKSENVDCVTRLFIESLSEETHL